MVGRLNVVLRKIIAPLVPSFLKRFTDCNALLYGKVQWWDAQTCSCGKVQIGNRDVHRVVHDGAFNRSSIATHALLVHATLVHTQLLGSRCSERPRAKHVIQPTSHPGSGTTWKKQKGEGGWVKKQGLWLKERGGTVEQRQSYPRMACSWVQCRTSVQRNSPNRFDNSDEHSRNSLNRFDSFDEHSRILSELAKPFR